MTRIDSPHCTGKILAANDTTHCVGLEGDCSGKPDDSTTSPQLSVKRNFPKVDSSPPTIDWAKTFKGGMSAGGSVHHTSSPPPLDPPEPSDAELWKYVTAILDGEGVGSLSMIRKAISEARERGRQEVAKRLPRLWGYWDGTDWKRRSNTHKPILDDAHDPSRGEWWTMGVYGSVYCEYDPTTGRPKE